MATANIAKARGAAVRGRSAIRLHRGPMGELSIVHYRSGPYLEADGEPLMRLTPTRVRKIIGALMPFAEWTPNMYRSEDKP